MPRELNFGNQRFPNDKVSVQCGKLIDMNAFSNSTLVSKMDKLVKRYISNYRVMGSTLSRSWRFFITFLGCMKTYVFEYATFRYMT